jgi:3',5'-cyclic AMP phosphodiesterase CpdA
MPSLQGQKFCANCGASLEPVSGPVKDAVQSAAREEVRLALQSYIKDQRIAEFDVTENVINRLIGWAKTIGILFGVVLVVAGWFGFKSFSDQVQSLKDQVSREVQGFKAQISKEVEGFKADLQPIIQSAKHESDHLKQQISDTEGSILDLQKQGANLKGEYAALESDANNLRGAKARIDFLGEQLVAQIERLSKQAAATNQEVETLKNRVDRLVSCQPLPPPTGPKPYHLSLSQIVGDTAVAEIQNAGRLVFHMTGGTGGINNPIPQERVAAAMASQLTGNQKAAFLYILGNLVYWHGEAKYYYEQFYKPYSYYAAPIFAIPGNHDGDPPASSADEPSLSAFTRNFLSRVAMRTLDAGDATRVAMTQPNSYWTLEAPYAAIVGLYTNVPQGGCLDEEQREWLVSELKAAPKDKALIVAMHHSPYSVNSLRSPSGARSNDPVGPMGKALDEAIAAAGRAPDIVFSAEAHLYMRFTRERAGHNIPYLVVGTGGYFHLYRLPKSALRRIPTQTAIPGVTLEHYDDSHHGFVRATVSKDKLLVELFATDESGGSDSNAPILADSFTLDLGSHKVVAAASKQ